MFTVEQIKEAHSKVKSGADFPQYIQEIKILGVTAFETWVKTATQNTLVFIIIELHQHACMKIWLLLIRPTNQNLSIHLKYISREKQTISLSASIVLKQALRSGLFVLTK